MKINNTNSNIIDLIRIFAAWLVLVGHTFAFVGKETSARLTIQNAGVVILFILAGFLTAYSLVRHNESNEYSWREYFYGRIIRLLPGLIIALVFILIVDGIHIYIDPNTYSYFNTFKGLNLIGNLLFLQNYPLIGDYIEPLGSGRPLWTLSLEFWLYLGIGGVYLGICNQKKQKLYETILLGICLIPVISNISTASRGGGLSIAFFFGFLVFFIYRCISITTSYIGLALGVILLVIYSIFYEDPYTIWFFALISMILACMLAIGQSYDGKRLRFLPKISGYTYMLYLIHCTIVEIVCVNNIFEGIHIKIVLSLIISNVVSIALYFWAEKPLRCIFDKIYANMMRMCDKKE